MSDGGALRIGVVGCGAMGRHHLRTLSGMPGCRIVAVCDTDRARATEAAEACGAEIVASPREMSGMVDAATVAVPTASHREVTEPLLAAGVDVLVEKPLAASLEDADALIALAGDRRILAVGHVERFNPAVTALEALADRPRFIEVDRLGEFPERSTDVDAVLDLMVHDLDIVLQLVARPIASLQAVGIPVLTDRVDIANVRIGFEEGCVANLTASRVSRETTRKIRLFQHDAYVSVDYAGRKGRVIRLDRGDPLRPRIVSEELPVKEGDPLALEMEDFLRAVRERSAARVPAWQGRRALEAALRVRDAISRSLPRTSIERA